jgi:TetR/AcrR family transcriptional regulator
MKNKIRVSGENEERILKEGWQLFQHKGYRGVTTDEICTRCNITKPTLYYYYKDKESLFVQILTFQLKELHAHISAAGDFNHRLFSTAQSILTHFQTGYTILVHDRANIKKSENKTLLKNAFQNELFHPVLELMRSGIEEGILKQEDPEILTLVFLGMLDNFIGKASEMNLDQDNLTRILINYFLNGVSKNG